MRPDQVVTVAPDASLLELTPVTLLLHKPVGFEAGLGLPQGAAAHGSRSQGAAQAITLLSAASHLPEDASGIRVLQRHFKQQECFTPLPTEASGLVVYTQDKRIARKLAEDIRVAGAGMHRRGGGRDCAQRAAAPVPRPVVQRAAAAPPSR